nr:S8 family serine peptidase [Lactobacillus xujianguonis]
MAVAVIDSGIDVDHKDFQTMPKDPKLTADEMKEKIKELGYGRYVNEKIPYAYNYVDNENEHLKGPDNEPHGQHVSGTIAADGHPDGDNEYVVGVAPQAQLLHLKVFGDTTTSLDLAKEIYDAVNLGADVIQMSLGGGVSAADLNSADQRAVQYAIDHGVIVSISASNNGNSASVDNPSKITDLTDYQPGGERGNYLPFSSSTVANPGAARGAITVAAENSGLGKNSDMASFTSWGPLPDYTLKPDISAPGVDVISTANDNGYTTMSGTSMAGPFVAGAATLVKQRLLKTNPELKGAALVEAVKALLMNTAVPQTQYGFDTPVSPRRQGAGQINVGAATKSQVYVTAANGTGSLSLRQIKDGSEFELTFHNLSNQAQAFTFDDMGGGFTEIRDEDTGLFHDVQLAGASVFGENTVELAANETKTVKYVLNLAGLKNNQLVEGFLNFKSNNGGVDLSVPYLGYYGDMTSEDVFDQNANDAAPDIQGNHLVNEDSYPRGIADEESLKALVNVDGTYNWKEVAKLYESGKVAFSPNNNQKSDLLKPVAYLKQNLEDLKVEILDANGNVVRVLSDNHGPEKSYHDDHNGMMDLSSTVNNSDTLEWDGKLYDKTTGKMVVASDGQYTYRFVATLYNNGEHKVQTNDTPVIIDTTAPVLSNVQYDASTFTLSGDYADAGAGFTDYSYATVTVNDHVFGFKLNDGAKSNFDNADKTKGHFVFVLTPEEQEALTSAANKVTVAFSDVADNTATQTFDVAPVTGHKKIAVWNAVNGLPFNENSDDYNADRKVFMLRGGADHDFYVNGKWVQVDQGQFVLPVSVDEQNFVFSSDQAGKNVLGKFTTFTPKANFAWQHVDGEERSFGAHVYSVEGENPQDIVVQAAVPKGDNVKAFAKDYFTHEVYTGEVHDGVATFHIHTSINKDDATGIYLRALLQGWVEIDGPTFNAKQVTDPTPINDANYLGVYYNPHAEERKNYTDRDDLGVDFKDEAADADSFGPGDHSSSTDDAKIHFDYLNNNGISALGNEAIENGYYDPETHKFTVTGQVDPSVISLTFLADSPYEVAPENQADIHNNGKFSVTFTINNPATRQLSYILKTNDGKTTRGSVTLVLDTVVPTLTVDQMGDQDEVEITTNKPTFKLSGEANDNVDGYNVFINGDNVFGQFGNSGYDYLPGIYNDPDQKTPNLYGSYKFDQEEKLDDQNGQPTTHVFTVEVVDQFGNKAQKKITVHYDPSYVAEPANDDKKGDQAGAQPGEDQKPNDNKQDQHDNQPVDNPSGDDHKDNQDQSGEEQKPENGQASGQPADKSNNTDDNQSTENPDQGKTDANQPSDNDQSAAKPGNDGQNEGHDDSQSGQEQKPNAGQDQSADKSGDASGDQSSEQTGKTDADQSSGNDQSAAKPGNEDQSQKPNDDKNDNQAGSHSEQEQKPSEGNGEQANPVTKPNTDDQSADNADNNSQNQPANKPDQEKQPSGGDDHSVEVSTNPVQTEQPSQGDDQSQVASNEPVNSNGADSQPVANQASPSNDNVQSPVTEPATSASGNEQKNQSEQVPADNSSVDVHQPKATQDKSQLKKFRLAKNACGYTSKGKVAKKHGNGKKLLFKKGKYLLAWNNGKVVTIKGHKYYQVAKNVFVKVSSTKPVKALKLVLTKDTFVYNKQGKRVKYNGHRVLKKGKSLSVLNNGKVVIIKGKQFYQVGKNQFVEVANAKLVRK